MAKLYERSENKCKKINSKIDSLTGKSLLLD